MKKGFNLSDWALNHRSLVWYFMLVFLVAGLVSYLHLGRQEDPDFTVKTMVVEADWPGASVDETVGKEAAGTRHARLYAIGDDGRQIRGVCLPQGDHTCEGRR